MRQWGGILVVSAEVSFQVSSFKFQVVRKVESRDMFVIEGNIKPRMMRYLLRRHDKWCEG